MAGRLTRRTLTPTEQRLAEAVRLETVAFERLGRCGGCLNLARAFVVGGTSGSATCPTCGGVWQEPSVLTLVKRVVELRESGRPSTRLPGF